MRLNFQPMDETRGLSLNKLRAIRDSEVLKDFKLTFDSEILMFSLIAENKTISDDELLSIESKIESICNPLAVSFEVEII